ncbi:hypothetical protein AGABI1DRAFT_111243 [Agaricus bisporus var. burnettii JB137-S8]|uniref:Uncharacterized protein n=1 Tax=Agaricus bisporus var. burnettii (strain JB137-S8 / ATCC MYA-4627 / FGSC 10392) TaxID=597362 RepID=K5Y3V6_AGABU|nr:uncharacterized protein AGABI1DRAFT_111243 [Agaricus bisporus var. burnettii JB137-S8]EKM82660.1 hypothetical protein AGABI1DRAFT_111243 [Agaricus bisporus var. burnettii JB137-S8]
MTPPVKHWADKRDGVKPSGIGNPLLQQMQGQICRELEAPKRRSEPFGLGTAIAIFCHCWKSYFWNGERAKTMA